MGRRLIHILHPTDNVATALVDLAPGDHVHTHNVESQRGRGDLHPLGSRQ